jgi:hypothetical protein
MSDNAKNKFNEAARSEAIATLTIVLSVQVVCAPKIGQQGPTPIENTEGKINKKAIGYIYGFIDAALQSRGIEITNLDVGLPIIYHVLRNLFPNHQEKFVDFLMHHMDDEIVVLGMMEGGQQYNDFLRDDGKPMGLAKFIYEGQTKSD